MSDMVPFNWKARKLVPRKFGDLYNMLDDFFADADLPVRDLAKSTFKMDISEKDKEYQIEAELPGFAKDEVSIELDEGRLIITAKKESTKEEEQKNYIHKERTYTSMCRSIYLGDASEKGIQAKLSGGILTVNVPKKEPATGKKQKIAIE